jgi:hypothetical protein
MVKPRKGEVGGTIRFDDIGDREAPELAVHALDANGDVLASTKVDADGTFALKAEAVDAARQVRIGPSTAEPTDAEAFHEYRASTFRRLIEVGDLNLGPRAWGRFFSVKRCIDATIEKCWWWQLPILPNLPIGLDQLEFERQFSPVPPIWPPIPPPPPIKLCAPICEGVVEVYRRTCCCEPPVFEPPVDGPRVPDFPWDPPIPVPEPWPDPFPGPRPQPGPDPVPFELADRFLTDGTLDRAKVDVVRRELALRSPAIANQLVSHPFWCTCGPATKVAQGFVGEGGAIHICWTEPLRLLLAKCHDEFAFVVKQNIGGSTVTVYNGVGAGQWFELGDDIELTTYHPSAVGCGSPGFPADPGGNYVVLQDIGGTEAHRLDTPDPDGPNSVQNPSSTSGLLDLGVDYALGGSVNLRYHFSKGMQTMGARYYRVRVARSNGVGDPIGTWQTVDAPAWKTWEVVGTSIQKGSHALGPQTVGTESDLFAIPFDSGVPLAGNEEWQDGQFHAVLDTTGLSTGRHLVRIEVFDAGGARLEPGSDPFTYLRWSDPVNTTPIGFAAMTHMIWVDNRPVVADIADVTGPGATMGDCKFFSGGAGDHVHVHYDAFHPQVGPPSFLHSYSLVISRGINGGSVSSLSSSTPAQSATHSVTLGQLLGTEDKCSFAVNLTVRARVHNGFGRLSGLDRHDVAAFAADQS